MRRAKIYYLLLFIFLSASCMAQKMPERGLVRKGNRLYGKEKYDKAVDSYLEALKAAPGNFEASYDLASALMRTERYERSEQILTKLLVDSTRTDIERSEVAYNLGDVQFAQQKLKESLASFRKAMRLNPDDQEAKYNYAYVKKMLEDQQNNQNQDQQNNQDQNKDSKQNQDQNKDQQDNNQDQNKDNQQDPNSGQDKNDNQDQNQKQDSGMSQKEQEAMLEAIQAQEDKTQEKLKEKKGVLIRKAKNW